VAAVFRSQLRNLAFTAGFVSVVSFLVLAAFSDPLTQGVQRVVTADWVALPCLAGGLAAHVLEHTRKRKALTSATN
jgi:hypothetical protein